MKLKEILVGLDKIRAKGELDVEFQTYRVIQKK